MLFLKKHVRHKYRKCYFLKNIADIDIGNVI